MGQWDSEMGQGLGIPQLCRSRAKSKQGLRWTVCAIRHRLGGTNRYGLKSRKGMAYPSDGPSLLLLPGWAANPALGLRRAGPTGQGLALCRAE